MEKNNKQKIIIAIVAVMLIAIVIAGGTYAFWYWQSDAGNQTAVNFVISRPGFTITGNNVSSSSLVPTTNCAHSTYAMMGNATVSATNDTSATMRATITLKGRLTPQSGRTLSNADKGHIHWAIKEVESASVSTYATANCSAASTANSASYTTGIFTDIGATYTDIATTITFDVNPNGSATKYYQVYAWIDSGYTYTTTGGAATDPMQGLTVDLTFSESSSFTQNISVAQNEFTLADVPEEDGPYIYTLADYVTASINEPIPSEDYPYFTTRAEVIDEFYNEDGRNWGWEGDMDIVYYLRHKVENNYITESYIEFIIPSGYIEKGLEECEYGRGRNLTDEEYTECVNNYNAIKPGIYHIKGYDLTAISDNINILTDAFGSGLCAEYDNGETYDCQTPAGFSIRTETNGHIEAVFGYNTCYVDYYNTSICTEY